MCLSRPLFSLHLMSRVPSFSHLGCLDLTAGVKIDSKLVSSDVGKDDGADDL